MFNEIYQRALEFKRKYPRTLAFRIKAHCKVAAKYIGSDEKVEYVFLAQKNFRSYEILNTNIIVLTNKRIIVATKRLAFGHFFRIITPDMFNDLTIRSGILWGKVTIDTVKELIILSNIDPNALAEIDDNVTMSMIEKRKKYDIKED